MNASLYVGDLAPDVNETMLYEFFREAGSIVSVKVCRDALSQKSLGYAYVNFQTPEVAAQVYEKLNFLPIRGKPVRLMFIQRDPQIRKSGLGNIFIKNLDKSIDNKMLFETFQRFGNILSCKVCTSKTEKLVNGKLVVDEEPIGYGFVHFDSQEAADAAIKKVNGMLIAEKKVVVTPFIRRQDRLKNQETLGFTNVYVKDLDPSIDSKALEKIFSGYGKVTSCVIAMDGAGKSKQFGFVNFEKPQSAQDAIAALNGKEQEGLSAKGKPLFVGKAEKKQERLKKLREGYEKKRNELLQKYQGLNVYVKNLDDQTDDAKLKEMFSQYGELESFRVMRDEHGISRGFGFVCFKKPEDVAKAIAEMNGKTLSGKPLIVTLAQRREQRRQELEQLFMQRQQQMQQTGGRHQGFNSGYRTQQYQIKPRFMGGQQRFQKVQQGQQQTQTSGQFQKDGGRKQGIPQQGQQAIKSQQQKPHQGQQQTTTAGTGEVKFQQNVRNQQTQQKSSKKQQGDQQPQQQIQQQQAGQQKPNAGQQQQTGTSRPGLDATHLASLNPLAQKQILGENLYPLVQEMQPALAGKITGMLLEMDNSDILILLESPEALISKVTEAVTVLKAHNIQ